ncbi:hypothetical protein [Cryobacterium ruanii]|nr:hypothetical protein [Cryobacterium ruanii]
MNFRQGSFGTVFNSVRYSNGSMFAVVVAPIGAAIYLIRGY